MGLNLEPAIERAAIGGRRRHRATFYGLVRELAPHIEMEDTRFRKCIAPDHRIAINLWHVAHSGSACNVTGYRFGVRTSTVLGIILRVCKAIFMVMSYKLAFPAGQWAREVITALIDSSVLMTVIFGSSQRLVICTCVQFVSQPHVCVTSSTSLQHNIALFRT